MRFPTRQYDSQLYPSPSSPYYQFGYQQRFPFAWSGGAGGVLPDSRSPSESQLGMADMLESGYGDPNWLPYPPLQRTILHPRPFALSDWPLVRPAGPEPLSPGEGGVPLGALSDNEKKLALVAAAAAAAWFLFFRKRRRRNPRRRGYYVVSKVRGVSGAIVLPTKQEAVAYANYLRRGGKPARIKKR